MEDNGRDSMRPVFLATLGECYSKYGIRSDQEIEAIVRKNPESLQTWLLCAAVRHLDRLEDLMSDLEETTRGMAVVMDSRVRPRPGDPSTRDPCADGLLFCWGENPGDREIASCGTAGLGVRARKAIRAAMSGHGVTHLSQLTGDLLMTINGCGETTQRELERWRDRLLSPGYRDEAQAAADGDPAGTSE